MILKENIVPVEHNDWALDMHEIMIRNSLQSARDLLNGKFHWYIWLDPKDYNAYADTFIKEAEIALKQLELEIKGRKTMCKDKYVYTRKL